MKTKMLCKVAEFEHKTEIHHNHKKIERISRKFGVKARFWRRKHPQNYYKESKERRKNLHRNKLKRDSNPTSPNGKLVTDISHFKVKEGWLYLSPLMDLFHTILDLIDNSYNLLR